MLHSPRFSLFKMFASRGIDEAQVEAVLLHLTSNPPGYLKKVIDGYALTPTGEEFIKTGGYKEQAKRVATEKVSNQQDRDLTRLVNKSVLDTNNSVQQTHLFQKKSTVATIIVAICALLISLFGLLKDEGKPSVESLIRQQIVMQKEIDSLRFVIKERSALDSLQAKKHH